MSSIFASSAGAASDAVLLIELSIGVLLVAGALAVRSGRVRLHKYLQSTLVLVNIPIVLVWMVPQYYANVWPGLWGKFFEPYYLIPSLMLAAGLAAEVLGVYIILVAGTDWIPPRLRFHRYKVWMRIELGLWWAVLVAGLTTYYLWYSA